LKKLAAIAELHASADRQIVDDRAVGLKRLAVAEAKILRDRLKLPPPFMPLRLAKPTLTLPKLAQLPVMNMTPISSGRSNFSNPHDRKALDEIITVPLRRVMGQLQEHFTGLHETVATTVSQCERLSSAEELFGGVRLTLERLNATQFQWLSERRGLANANPAAETGTDSALEQVAAEVHATLDVVAADLRKCQRETTALSDAHAILDRQEPSPEQQLVELSGEYHKLHRYVLQLMPEFRDTMEAVAIAQGRLAAERCMLDLHRAAQQTEHEKGRARNKELQLAVQDLIRRQAQVAVRGMGVLSNDTVASSTLDDEASLVPRSDASMALRQPPVDANVTENYADAETTS
jgi:hypothetical protein